MASEGRAISIQRHDRVNIQWWPDAGKIHTDSARETNKLRHYRNRGINTLATTKSGSDQVYPRSPSHWRARSGYNEGDCASLHAAFNRVFKVRIDWKRRALTPEACWRAIKCRGSRRGAVALRSIDWLLDDCGIKDTECFAPWLRVKHTSCERGALQTANRSLSPPASPSSSSFSTLVKLARPRSLSR